ncbi:MAG: substrate-binding domain-containing protein [Actinomycetota bacterium]
MTELLPPTRSDRVRSVVMLLVLLAVFAGVAAVVDALNDEPTEVVTNRPAASADADDEPVGELEGDFLVTGSSTVFPIMQLQGERFNDLHPGVAIGVEGPGSGDGARKFCNGEASIGNASRRYKEEEIAVCEENGIEFIELRRGVDGITVITDPANDAVECLSFNDLYALLSEEAVGFGSWGQANALTAEWGGTEFPDLPLAVFGPGEESGTFDSFGEIVIESVFKGKTGLDTEAREYVETVRPDYTASPNDNVIVEGITNSPFSLGWVGFAFASEAEEDGRVRTVPISVEDGGDCITPTAETISDASFPIARFLYTYVNADDAVNDPAVAAFMDYALSEEGLSAVTEAGYVDLPQSDLTRAATIWNARLTGTGQWE